MRLLVVPVLLLVAGCAEPQTMPSATQTTMPTLPTTTDAPPAPPATLQQFGCQSRYGYFEVDADYVERTLPEGFQADTVNSLLTAGTLAVKVWTCDHSTLAGESLQAPRTLLYYLAVRPPEQYAAPDAAAHWLVLGWVSSNPREAALFASWNMTDAAAGNVSIDSSSVGGASKVDATASAPGFEASYDGILGPQRESGSFSVRYFGLRDGKVAGIVDITVHDGLRVANGEATAVIQAPRSPGDRPLAGAASEQVWPADALAYTWTPVALPG